MPRTDRARPCCGLQRRCDLTASVRGVPAASMRPARLLWMREHARLQVVSRQMVALPPHSDRIRSGPRRRRPSRHRSRKGVSAPNSEPREATKDSLALRAAHGRPARSTWRSGGNRPSAPTVSVRRASVASAGLVWGSFGAHVERVWGGRCVGPTGSAPPRRSEVRADAGSDCAERRRRWREGAPARVCEGGAGELQSSSGTSFFMHSVAKDGTLAALGRRARAAGLWHLSRWLLGTRARSVRGACVVGSVALGARSAARACCQDRWGGLVEHCASFGSVTPSSSDPSGVSGGVELRGHSWATYLCVCV